VAPRAVTLVAILALLLAAGLALLLGARRGLFDPPYPQGMVENPCPRPGPKRTGIRHDIDRMLRQDSERMKLRDWAGLCYYRRANAALQARGVRPQVVMIGDSITELWQEADPALFGDRIVNRGIGGQTSAQMLVRFRQDVVALQPRVVHVMAGLNDIAGSTGANRPEDFRNNVRSMIDIAQANGIAVVIAGLTPVRPGSSRTRNRPMPVIAALNGWLRAFAAERGVTFVDYGPALAGSGKPAAPVFLDDGLHLTPEAYAALQPLAMAAIEGAAAGTGGPVPAGPGR
jgi:lysophospholipase L1-like esterase